MPAAPEDRVFCLNLGRHAVHAGMAGKTGMVVARWHQRFVHLPMSLVTIRTITREKNGSVWITHLVQGWQENGKWMRAAA